ncbi:hypothetical protein [Clostridium sartagoforme]|uniref:hypothetical protein n=1 Tax=Clostridium sartagoforme TaxID=84031 RepID=UPI00039C5705|nr:hypothetical protein [Clostridium sartagoforme]
MTTANKINECLDELRKLYQLKDLTSSYVELSVSVDYTNNKKQDKYSKMINIIADIESRLSFIESEIIQVNDEALDAAISASKENSNYLKDKKREKEYALHPEVERVLAALSGTLEGPYKVYE